MATTTGSWNPWAPIGNASWFLLLGAGPLSAELSVPGMSGLSHLFFPLSPHRACVAGFTNIAFNPRNEGLIDGNESYVSFSPCSEAIFLPQDPGRGARVLLAVH